VRRLYYGWVIVGAAFTIMMVGFGVAYMFAAFFESLESEFAASRGDISMVFSICGLLYFMLGAVSGPLADRIGPRLVIGAGMILIALGLALASQATALWQVYLTYSLAVGLGVGFSYVPAVAVVTRWFVRHRGAAAGIAVAGIGVGTMIGAPLAAALIAWSDWRTTYLVLAVASLVLGLGATALLHARPEDRGLHPDGAAVPAAAGSGAGDGLALGEALRSRLFHVYYLSAALLSLGLFVPFVHLAKYAADHGLGEATGVVMISLIGVGSMLGRFLLGGLADRWGRLATMTAMYFGLAVMDLWWLLADAGWALALFAVVYGVFYGGFVALAPALTTDYFGGRAASGIIGVLYTGPGIGAFVGPLAAGWTYDLTGSYTPVILAMALCSVAAGLLIMTLPRPTPQLANGRT